MATVDFFTGFSYKWAQDGTVDPIADTQWRSGWQFIGASPPTVEQFNKWGQIYDEKSNWLFGQVKGATDAAGLTLSSGNVNSLRDAIFANAGGSRVRGLTGNANAGTPGTQYDFTAIEAVLRNATTGGTVRLTPTGVLTNNILTAGPAANGRDQAGAFAAGQWVSFYYIWNGTTLATISTVSAGPPTLPSGYTHLAYIGSVYLNGSSQLAAGYFRGSWFHYRTAVVVVNAGTAVLRTAVPLSAAIPPIALNFKLRVGPYQLQSNGAGTYLGQVNIEVATAYDAWVYGIGGTGGANLNMLAYGGIAVLPNVNQSLNYFHVVTSGSLPIATILVDGYNVPNGGE